MQMEWVDDLFFSALESCPKLEKVHYVPQTWANNSFWHFPASSTFLQSVAGPNGECQCWISSQPAPCMWAVARSCIWPPVTAFTAGPCRLQCSLIYVPVSILFSFRILHLGSRIVTELAPCLVPCASQDRLQGHHDPLLDKCFAMVAGMDLYILIIAS